MVSRLLSTDFARTLCRFSLRGFLVVITLASIGFITWWRWPVLLERLPTELGPELPKGPYCATGWDPTALWSEEWRHEDDPRKRVLGNGVHAATGKCWGRRDWQQGWILDGPAELFTKDKQRIIRAEFASGQLHGPFCSWYTDGKVRETGAYHRGAKHGVWKLFDHQRGETRTEFDRGKKTGLWDLGSERLHYRDDELVKREHRSNLTGYDWQTSELDADGKVRHVEYWNADRTQQVGVEHYSGGKRHGDWHRVRPAGERAVTHRGRWTNGLPNGEWVFERESGPPRRFEFQKGALVKVDGTPRHDWLMQRAALDVVAVQKLQNSLELIENYPDQFFAGNERTRQELLEHIPFYNRLPLCVDPRLELTQEQLDSLLQEKLPTDFDFVDLPETAAMCLAFHDAGLCFDYRLGIIWLTSPEFAEKWRDETGASDWFQAIASDEKHEVVEQGQMFVVEERDLRRVKHFGSSSRNEWEDDRFLQLEVPFETKAGIVRQLDGQLATGTPVAFPPTVREDSLHFLEIDERIPIECELYRCRLLLRGDTLVMEPQK